MSDRSRLLAALAGLLLLAGCGQETLYSGLEEREANEMVSALARAGLPGEKRGDLAGGFSVATSGGAFPDAVDVLRRNGLPRQRYETIGDVFDDEGFVSSPLEERARLNYALSQEIAHTISDIDGVVSARVHLAVPERDELGERPSPASASVFVKHRDTVDLTGSVGAIKALVVNGIENLPYDNVTVALFPTRTEAAPARPAPGATVAFGTGRLESASAAVAPLAGPASALAIALGGGLCVWLGWFRGRPGKGAGTSDRTDRTDGADGR